MLPFPRCLLSWRVLLAGPLVFVCAVLLMGGAAVLIPPGPANINQVAIPLVLFPAAWGLLFFYACLEPRLGRAFFVVIALMGSHGSLIVWHVMRTAEALGR